jgi:lipopolysaccharide/colanic/teichoic acid biosynthesis glycosyltransferase
MYAKIFKRILDLVVAIIALPFVCIVILVFAPFIYFEDKGPVFYNAERLGKNGKVFKMFKLRSMKVNSPNLVTKDGQTFNSDKDPRVTKIGRFMRKTSIDELPQFLNVLIGDMSIIGPRAHLTTHYKGYEFLDEIRKKRLAVRPGITGYNQAYYRNSVTLDEKLKNDCFYVDHLTFLMDVKVFFKTIISVLKHENVFVENVKTEQEDKTK